MGRHTVFSARDVSSINDAIGEILEEYGQVVYEATSMSMDAAANEAIRVLKIAGPKDVTGRFRKGWKAVGSGRFRRYVGNTTTVPSKSKNGIEEETSLANIFEYSTTGDNTQVKPFIKQTIEDNAEGIARAAIEEIIRNI